MRALSVHTVPIWEEPDGTLRPPNLAEGEIRDDLPVAGWGNVMHIELAGQDEWLLLVFPA